MTMDFISLSLGVLGIILTIILSDPVYRLFALIISIMRKRIWSAQAYREGRLQNCRHFGFEDWSLKIDVDKDGSTTQKFDARIVNLSNQLLRTLYIPFFTDAAATARFELEAWARAGRKAMPVELDFVDERRSQGRVAISHIPPIKPGERRRLHWGFRLPRVFGPGDEYYIWDIEVPHYQMQGSITFSAEWNVLYARWVPSSAHHSPTITVTENSISWSTTLPQPGTRLHLKLGLGCNRD